MDDTRRKKRKLSAPHTKQAAQKRLKVKAGHHAATQPRSEAKRVVAADSLPWTAVAVPEMFNDAEGFFGLEEVTGVEVVRDGDNVRFVSTASAAAGSGDDGDEFEGFDDGPVPESTTEPQQDAVAKLEEKKKKKTNEPREEASKDGSGRKPRPEKKTKKKEKRGAAAARPASDPELEDNVFSSLADADNAGDDEVDMSAWVPLELTPSLLSSLAKLKFSKPTAIQAAAIPHILAGHDVIGKASTGSGKTLAFGIPIVETWLALQDEGQETEGQARKHDGPIALILSPTRELAHQLTSHIREMCAGLPSTPYVCAVTGGLSVHKQQRQLEKADIVVGTPGRMWEVLSGSTDLMDSFRRIHFLVVDEADRILTEGHFQEAKEILDALDREVRDEEEEEKEEEKAAGGGQAPAQRQTLVFSATFNRGLQQKLAGKGKKGSGGSSSGGNDLLSQQQSMEYLLERLNFREERPKFVDVNPVSQMASGLREGLVECGALEKDLYLYTLLLHLPGKRALVFTNSIASVRRLAPMLQNLNIAALPLHSQMPQKARLRSVERFTAASPGAGAVLVATDVAARGLDIPGIDAVLHYHVPRAADAYVHRSGRTARASASGLSILICGPEEATPTRRLVAKVHARNSRGGGGPDKGGKDFFIRTVDLDRRLAGRLRERVDLAKRIADSTLAKEKGGKEDSWMRAAAEELGVDYDSDAAEAAGQWGGRGAGRIQKQRAAAALTKGEVAAMRAELRALLARRVNTGVSERYITSGGVDVDELLKGGNGEFFGRIGGLGLDD